MAKGVMLALNAVLVLLFVLGYVARYVPPKTFWWLQLVGIGLPFLAAAVVLATALAGLMGSRSLFVLYLVLCVLIGVRYAPRGATTRGGPGEGAPLRVLTFNADPGYVGRPEAVEALLQEHRPDVVALQEAGIRGVGGDMLMSGILLPLIEDPGFEIRMPDEGWGGKTFRLPVFTRAAWVDFEVIPLYPHPYDDDRGEVARAEVEWDGVRVAVYNLHLHSFGPERPWRGGWRERLSPGSWLEAFLAYREDFVVRADEARQVRALLEAEPLPFIVCGDLNTTPDQWVYRHLARGLTDAFAAAGRGLGGTYHVQLPFARIDYILASEHWAVSWAGVLREAASDHRPVGAVLHLADPEDPYPSHD